MDFISLFLLAVIEAVGFMWKGYRHGRIYCEPLVFGYRESGQLTIIREFAHEDLGGS